MAGLVYTFVSKGTSPTNDGAITTSQGTVALGQSGLFLPGEYQAVIGEGLNLVAGPAQSPSSLLSAPTVGAGASGAPNGVYRCAVTFVTAAGETQIGPAASVTVTNDQIAWSAIPTAPASAGVLSRKLYRTVAGGGAGTEKLVTTLADDSTTTYTDNVADGSLGVTCPTSDTSAVIGGVSSINPQPDFALLTGNPADDAYVIGAGTGAKVSPSGSGSPGLPAALTGATAATRYVGGTTSGAPVSGTFATGDFVIDQTAAAWVCTTAGSPGTWASLSGGSGVSVGNPVSGGAASSVLVTDASGNIQSQATPTSAYRRAVWNGTAWKAELAGAVDICAEFGVGTGVTDNSTAINTALATLGALGIEAYLPFPGVGHFYAIQNPVIIGNGSSSAFSTWSAFLRGGGWPGGASTTNEAAPIETKLKWTGSSGYSDAMVQIVGPLTGWGLKNLRIDGGAVPGTPGNAPAFALHTTSSVHGRVDNIGFSGCISGIHHDAYSSVSGALTGVVVDDLMNMVNNVSIQWIGKTAVHSYGLLFDGGANGVSNACYTEYKGVIMTPPNSSYGGGTINDGVYFKKCDSILIHNITCTGPSGTDTNRLVFYDWTGVSKWPKSCFIDVIDFDTGLSTCVSSTGTPTNFAGGMAHNKISNIHGANNQPGNPNVPWLMWGDNAYSGAIQLVSGAATIANVATQAGSYILVSVVTPATVAANQGIPFVNTKTAGTGFTLASTNASDNSWLMYRMFSDSYY